MSRKKVVYDSSDPEQVKNAQKDRDDRDRDIDYILASERGRRWVYELVFDKCHMHRLSHVPRDTHSTAFNEGSRAVGEAVLEEIRAHSFAKFMTMMEENHGDE